MMPPEEPDTGSYKIVFEIDYSHFVKLHGYLFGLQVLFGIFSIACNAPAPFPTQIYFLIVVIIGFIGTLSLSLIHLRWPIFNKVGKQAEFVYTASMAFFYFTAFTAQFADLGGFTTEEYAHRYAAQIVAGVFAVLTEITYFIIIYLMIPDLLMWYEEYQGGTKPQEPINNDS